ncbi:GNAT family N-acetyltransferase [Okibacterium endophyticum]
MSAPEIALAVPGDETRLAALAAATFPLACPPGSAPEAIAEHISAHLSAERFREYLADPQHTILIADIDGEARGYTMLVAEEAHPSVRRLLRATPSFELSKVYLHQDVHGTGMASALMASTLAKALELGAASVWLGVNKHNARAIRFYMRTGFVVVGSKRFAMGPELHDDHVMEYVF